MSNFIHRFIDFIHKLKSPPKDLNKHIFETYSDLRCAMGILGLILPLIIVVGGINSLRWLSSPLDVQTSLSAYYHAGADKLSCTALLGVYRDWFVGLLTAISVCLIAYKGFTPLENCLLNFAGLFLAGVAFFPTGWPEMQTLDVCQAAIPKFQPFEASKLLGLPIPIHSISAVLFFITITAVNVLTALDTVDAITHNENRKDFWMKVFMFARWLMPIAIGLVLLVRLLTGTAIIGDRLILWVEWAGIWAFSFYWILKSIEIRKSGGDIKLKIEK